MSLDSCVSATADELGMSKEDAEEIAARLAAERDRLSAAGGPAGLEDKLRAFAKTKAEEAKIAAALKRKAAALNVLTRDSLDKWIDRQTARGISPDKAIVSFLVGGPFAHDSIAARRVALEGDWIKGLLAEAGEKVPVAVEMIGAKPSRSKPFFDDVVREMTELREGGTPGKTKNKDARAFAGILAKYAEASRLEANKAGANIGRLDGWAGPQAHDEVRLLRAGQASWVARTLDRIDIERTFGPGTTAAEARDRLGQVFLNIVTGRDRVVSATEQGQRLGPSNIANSMGEHRVLHFKSADDWIAYADEFGRGNIVSGMLDHLHNAARKVSLMQKLGPNPEVMLKSVLEERARGLREGAGADPEAARKGINKLQLGYGLGGTEIGKAWAVVSGSANVPTNVSTARVFAYTRAVMGMAKLGASLASQFSDLATYAAAMHDQGRGIFQGQADALRGILAGGDEHRAMLLGVAGDSLAGDIQSRFGAGDELPGRVARMQAAFYKLAGVRWWTDRLEAAFANMTSANLAREAAQGWEGVNPAMRNLLTSHGITPDRWEVLRQAVVRADDGRGYMMPDRVAALPDEAFGGLGGDPAKARRELELDLRGFLAEEARHGVVKGDDRTRMTVTQGIPPGSALGEVIRFVMQFKSFSIAYAQGPLARQFRAYPGADPSAGLLRQVGGGLAQNIPAIASLIAASTFYGFWSMTAKDWLKDHTMKDPKRPATIMAALVQGGGLGLYGDYLFGQTDRFGGGIASSLLGPAIGEGVNLVELAQKARQGATDYAATGKQSDVGKADFINFGLRNLPYLNLHILRPALDLAVLNRLQEWASPGTFARRASTMKQQFGQEFLFSPLPHGTRP